MQTLHTTPHCGPYCRRAKDGTTWHVHGNAKRSRRRKRHCKDTCCAPRRARWRMRNAPREDD